MLTLWEEIKALLEHKVVFLDKERTKYAQINEKGKIVNEKGKTCSFSIILNNESDLIDFYNSMTIPNPDMSVASKPMLTDNEKEELKTFAKMAKKQIFVKRGGVRGCQMYLLTIMDKDENMLYQIDLSQRETAYKGVDCGKKYTMEELGLLTFIERQ